MSRAVGGLVDASTDDLAQLEDAVRKGSVRAPLSAVGLELSGLGHLWEAVQGIAGLDGPTLCLLLAAVLTERRRATASRLDLVWSGTDAGPSQARYTSIVIPELIAAAERHVTIAGYSFDQGGGVFELLHGAVQRGVKVRFFLDIQQLHARLAQHLKREHRAARLEPLERAREAGADVWADAVVSLFLELHWPFEGTRPELFYDPRTADERSFASLHAKCLVVDHERALVTSANFTDRGQSRNIEVGVLIHDKAYALALERQWNALVECGGVVRA